MAEITETARNAEAQIAQLASHSTDDDAGRPSSPQPMNHDPRHRHRDDDGDRNGGAALLTADGNIRPVAAFITIPHGASLSNYPLFLSVLLFFWLFSLKTFKALNSLLCDDVPLRNYSLTYLATKDIS